MTSIQKVIKGFAVGLGICIIVGIVSAVLGLLFAITGLEEGRFPLATREVNLESRTEYFEDVSSLDVNISFAELEIRSGDRYMVEFINVPEDTTLDKMRDGTLLIDMETNNNWVDRLFSGDWYEYDNAKIIVTLKETIPLKNVRLDTGSGKIHVENMKAERFELDTGSGEFYGNRISADGLFLDSGSGSVSLEQSSLNRLKLDIGSGRFYFSGSLEGDTEIDGGSGSITLDLDNLYDEYRFDVDAGSGGIWVNNDKMDEGFYGSRDAGKKMLIDGGSGRIVINLK